MNINSINTLRVLSGDMTAEAKSGHPGMALGVAPVVYALYHDIAKINPADPNFFDRDRIVFSAGHCSAVIYSALHLSGYDVTIDDLRKFRSLGSKTPGHPEFRLTPGVDCTSGPLGQGIATAVGLAIAEKHLADRFNKTDCELVDHYTYAIVGEGCLMEGISYEACSIAGNLKLNKLIVIYDCNNVSIDGNTNITFTEDIKLRFMAQGWSVNQVDTENDGYEGIVAAINQAKESDKPSLIIVPSIIGYGTANEGKNKSHGTPLTHEEAEELRIKFNLDKNPFSVGKDVYNDFSIVKKNGAKAQKEYNSKLSYYKKKYKDDYKEFERLFVDKVEPINLDIEEAIAGRDLGQVALNKLANITNNMIGGTADLASSTKQYITGGDDLKRDSYAGKNIRFGIREFAMGAITNGLALHGGLVPFCSTFLVFSDYLKAAMRLGALMKLKELFVFTHDSIEVGEDGETHQPVEQLNTLRMIPNLDVFRPCCGSEVAYSYVHAYNNDKPTAIILAKSKLLTNVVDIKDVSKGAYIIADAKKPCAIIVATGNEVGLAIKVKQILDSRGVDIRVVSMPCQELFLRQDEKYFRKIFPKNFDTIVTLEAGDTNSWRRFVGKKGLCIGVEEFGASGKSKDLYQKFGFDADVIADKVEKLARYNGTKIDSIFG